MRILLANKFYYPRGGDCVYTIELERLLQNKGHDVAIFAMQHSQNLQSAFSSYFPSEVDFSTKHIGLQFKVATRPIYSLEVKRKFSQLVHDFKPDVVHLNNVHSQLSPLLAQICYSKNIPVIWTMHDYKLACPASAFYRNGTVCTLCLKDKTNVVKQRCHKNSIMASMVAYAESVIWRPKKIQKYISAIIAPSSFLKSIITQVGIPNDKIKVMHNFLNLEKSLVNPKREKYIVYIGRLSKEKGLYTLLNSLKKLPEISLKIIGSGPLYDDFITNYALKNVEYLGFLSRENIFSILRNASFLVLPSECFDNNPLSVIESLCLGTPILGANIGGIPELIDNKNGMMFEAHNEKDLGEKILAMFDKTFDYEKISEKSLETFSAETYYDSVMQLYNKEIEAKRTPKSKLRILIANKFYYPRGGDCVYTIELERMLNKKGHDTAIFAMQHPQNFPSEYSCYFPSEVDFTSTKPKHYLKEVTRPIYSLEVKRKFKQLLHDFRPDVVHLNNIHSQLSPLLAQICYSKNIPVIWTMHDYKLACPASALYRNGTVCTLCLKDKTSVIKQKCHKGSLFASIVAYLESIIWRPKKIEKYIHSIIAPSGFLKSIITQVGIPSDKIRVMHNFLNLEQSVVNKKREKYIVFASRLSKEKGLYTLLKSIKNIPEISLKIIGTGPLYEDLIKNYAYNNVEYLGFLNRESIFNILKNASFLVLPSEWLENNPLSIIESLCLGTPVLAANIGGIPEIIDSTNGMLFEPYNEKDLEEKIIAMFDNSFDYGKISENAHEKFSTEVYYQGLTQLYYKSIANETGK